MKILQRRLRQQGNPKLFDSPTFPATIPGLALWLDSRWGLQTSSAAFAGAGTVSVTSNAATFSTSQDGSIAVGDSVTPTAGAARTVTARTSSTAFTLSAGADVAGGTAFTIAKRAPRVTQWNDRSGNGRNYAQATTNMQPTVSGLDINFDGFNDRFDAGAGALALTNTVSALSASVVVQMTSVATVVFQFRIGTGATDRFTLQSTSGPLWDLRAVRLDADTVQALLVDSAALTRTVLTHVLDYNNTKASRWVNGVAKATSSAFLTAGSTSATNSTGASIGSSGGSGFMAGSIRSLLIYTAALSATQRQNLDRWLGRQFGVPVS